MKKNSFCNELILKDVVAIELYPSEVLNFAIPPMVALDGLKAPDEMPSPEMVFNVDGEDGVEMSDVPTVHFTTERKAAGNIFTHDVSIPVLLATEEIENGVKWLQGSDYQIVYRFVDGTRKISYPLPNTFKAVLEVSLTSSTVKFTLQSMSGLIELI